MRNDNMVAGRTDVARSASRGVVFSTGIPPPPTRATLIARGAGEAKPLQAR